MLKSLKSLAKYKFSVVFATRRDLVGLVDEEILKDYWDFFVGNTVYLKIMDASALNYMFLQIEKVFEKQLTPDQKTKITKIAGGHAKLTKIITELVLGQKAPPETDSLLNIQQVQGALYEIWLFLTGEEQHELYLLSKNGKGQITPEAGSLHENLINFDLIRQKKQSSNLAFTIPIFEEFVKNTTPNTHEEITYNPQSREIKKGASIISELLSPQEYRLLEFLIQNQGTVIGRDEIISAVWPQTQVAEAISDEAIDQMVFRLRKKIEDEPATPKYILTVKGRGLKFEP
jgi:DNA-binding winged helix-turn-helix (wHTH) protein